MDTDAVGDPHAGFGRGRRRFRRGIGGGGGGGGGRREPHRRGERVGRRPGRRRRRRRRGRRARALRGVLRRARMSLRDDSRREPGDSRAAASFGPIRSRHLCDRRPPRGARVRLPRARRGAARRVRGGRRARRAPDPVRIDRGERRVVAIGGAGVAAPGPTTAQMRGTRGGSECRDRRDGRRCTRRILRAVARARARVRRRRPRLRTIQPDDDDR